MTRVAFLVGADLPAGDLQKGIFFLRAALYSGIMGYEKADTLENIEPKVLLCTAYTQYFCVQSTSYLILF